MTKKFVLSKLSNSDIDSLVATYVMNWACVQDEDNPYAVYIDQNTRHIKKHVDNFNPSEDISDAWDVVDFLGIGMLNKVHGIWECYHGNVVGKSVHAPRAICEAALLATSRDFIK